MLTADQWKSVLESKTPPQVSPARQWNRVRLTADGARLLAAGHDGLVHRWDLTSQPPTELPAMSGHNGWVTSLQLLQADRDDVVSADSWGQLRCTRLSGDTPQPVWTVAEAHDGWIVESAVSADGRLIATCGHDGRVCVWNSADGARLHAWNDHGCEVFSVTFAPDSQTLFSGDLRGVVQQRQLADGQLLRTFDASSLFTENRLQDVGGARVLAVSADHRQLLVGGTKPKNGGNVQGEPTLLVFDLTGDAANAAAESRLAPTQTRTLGVAGDVYITELIELIADQAGADPATAGQASAEGTSARQWLASISGNPGTGKVVALQLDQEAVVYETKKYANCHSIAWEPQSRRLAICTTNTGSNGNGRSLKDGEYKGNFSPVFLLTLPADEPAAAAPAQ